MRIRAEQPAVWTAPGAMEALLAAYGVPGCTLAVIREGEIAFSGAWGVRDHQGTPMTEGVLFECASLTKPVFAAAVMQLAQEGKFDLDAPVAPLLKEEKWSLDPRFDAITPRHCLCHGSGLPNWQAKPMALLFAPGTGFSYSGEGYFLLQRLAEQVEGQDLEQILRRRCFEPYGMAGAAACWTPRVCAAFSEGFGQDGSVRKVRDQRRVSGNAPEPNAAWSLYAWAGEYAKFLCALMNGKSGLTQAVLDAMTTPQNRAGEGVGWGLGFGIPEKDPSVRWHWGDNAGFQSFALWDQATKDGAVICTNSDNGQAFYWAVLEALAPAEFWEDVRRFVEGAE